MDDLISRQAAIEVIDAVFPVDPMKSEYAQGIACGAALAKRYVEQLPSAEPVRCKDCRWGREVCGNIECFVDSDIFTEYHAYEWFCPNGERKHDATG